jgi:hypothetical protein
MVIAHSTSGGCLCGAVRFETEAPSLFCVHDHCSWCQRAHGAAFVTWIGFRADAFAITRGAESELRWYASSAKSERGFCSRCGTTMFFRSELAPGEIHAALACVDDQSAFTPTAHIFWESHVSWLALTDELPKIGRDAKALAQYQVLPEKPPSVPKS